MRILMTGGAGFINAIKMSEITSYISYVTITSMVQVMFSSVISILR